MKILSARGLSNSDKEKNKKKYLDQFDSDKQAVDDFVSKVDEELKQLFATELASLPGLEVKFVKRYDKNRYVVIIKYGDPSSGPYYRPNNERYFTSEEQAKWGHKQYKIPKQGIGFIFCIYIGAGNEVVSEPVLKADMLKPEDYGKLKTIYEVLAKANATDWNKFFKRISAEAPAFNKKYNTFKDELRYGEENKINDQIEFSRLVGKDIWVDTHIQDKGSSLLRILSETKNSYIVNRLNYSFTHNELSSIYMIGDRWGRIKSEAEFNEECNKKYKFNKKQIHINQPETVYTTQELLDIITKDN